MWVPSINHLIHIQMFKIKNIEIQRISDPKNLRWKTFNILVVTPEIRIWDIWVNSITWHQALHVQHSVSQRGSFHGEVPSTVLLLCTFPFGTLNPLPSGIIWASNKSPVHKEAGKTVCMVTYTFNPFSTHQFPLCGSQFLCAMNSLQSEDNP